MPRTAPLVVLLIGAACAATGCAATSTRHAARTTASSSSVLQPGPASELARVVCGGLRGIDTATDAILEVFDRIEADSVDRQGLRRSLVAQVRGAADAAREGGRYIDLQAAKQGERERTYLEHVANELSDQAQQLQEWSQLVATFPIDDRDNWEDTWHSWRDSKFLPHVDVAHERALAVVAARPLGEAVLAAARALNECSTIDFTSRSSTAAPQK